MAQRLNPPDRAGVFHFVTLNIREGKAAFGRSQYAQMALLTLRFECDRHPARLIAYVAMPDHLHFLFAPEDGKISRFLCRFKPRVTLGIDTLAAAANREREREWLAAKGHRELWQDGKHSVPIRSLEWACRKIEYIHLNPVRAGLVENPEDYSWSSYGAYFPEWGIVPPVPVDALC